MMFGRFWAGEKFTVKWIKTSSSINLGIFRQKGVRTFKDPPELRISRRLVHLAWAVSMRTIDYTLEFLSFDTQRRLKIMVILPVRRSQCSRPQTIGEFPTFGGGCLTVSLSINAPINYFDSIKTIALRERFKRLIWNASFERNSWETLIDFRSLIPDPFVWLMLGG